MGNWLMVHPAPTPDVKTKSNVRRIRHAVHVPAPNNFKAQHGNWDRERLAKLKDSFESEYPRSLENYPSSQIVIRIQDSEIFQPASLSSISSWGSEYTQDLAPSDRAHREVSHAVRESCPLNFTASNFNTK